MEAAACEQGPGGPGDVGVHPQGEAQGAAHSRVPLHWLPEPLPRAAPGQGPEAHAHVGFGPCPRRLVCLKADSVHK